MNEKLTNGYFRSTYLEEVKKRSPGSYINNKLVIRDLIKEIPKPFVEITMIEIKEYFTNIIDEKEIKKTSKNSIRYMLMSFFNYIQKTLLSYKISFSNPVPSKKIFKFSTNVGDISHVSDEELKILNINQITKILDYTYDKIRDFILFGLTITSGARISEIRTIMIKDINLKNCSFQTGFIPGARKTTLHTNKGLLFFFPFGFKKYIKKYMETEKVPILFHPKRNFKNLWPNKDWFFPGYNNKCISKDTTQKILSEVRRKIKIKFTWHTFRRSRITAMSKKGCPLGISELLLNHAPSSVEGKSYIKLSIKDKRKLYDKYDPYKKILKALIKDE